MATDMKKTNDIVKLFLLNAAIAFVAFILQYNGTFGIKISTANPMLMLAVCIAFSMFSGELYSVIFALVLGIVTDGAAATPICFNTILFILISLSVSLTVHFLFNNNIRSAICLGLIGSAIYYIVRFIFCFSKNTLENSVGYILRYVLPSVIYTAVIVIILFFIEKKIFGKYYAR